MSEWPVLGGVKDVYALFRDDMPGGRFLAPAALMLLWAAFTLWALAFVWRSIYVPVAWALEHIHIRGPIFMDVRGPYLDPAPMIISAVIFLFSGILGPLVMQKTLRKMLETSKVIAEERKRLEELRQHAQPSNMSQ